MSSVALSTTVTFPSQQAITDYISSHPLKANAIDIHMYIPNSLPVIAKCFADKQMQRTEIEANVRKAIREAHEDHEKLTKLLEAVEQFVISCEEKGQGESELTSGLKRDVLSRPEPGLLTITVGVYKSALNDLLDGATFTPPKEKDGSWIKHVTKISADK